ncbi:MAG: D-inositol-3-phosphate glycosyltransferase [Firmicutes bacterium ADurb.Bin419]|nr:MAG: D-inositol-3-phosphate glycosyltransferase [Firmicutes bacterium ADurb.Bin419]
MFFYPASGTTYKNHKLIVETLLKFHEKKIDNFVVVFTLKGNENKHIKRLYNIVRKHNLPVTFIGQITMEEVFNYYSKSILIFPSYIETFGLPMFEAKMHGSPVLASDCSFSHEILDDYNKVMYFDPFDYEDLFEKMKAILGAHCNSKDEY